MAVFAFMLLLVSYHLGLEEDPSDLVACWRYPIAYMGYGVTVIVANQSWSPHFGSLYPTSRVGVDT